jgi:hypothetical protein
VPWLYRNTTCLELSYKTWRGRTLSSQALVGMGLVRQLTGGWLRMSALPVLTGSSENPRVGSSILSLATIKSAAWFEPGPLKQILRDLIY